MKVKASIRACFGVGETAFASPRWQSDALPLELMQSDRCSADGAPNAYVDLELALENDCVARLEVQVRVGIDLGET